MDEKKDKEYQEEFKNESNKKKIIIVSIVVVLFVGIATVLWFKGYDIINYVFAATSKVVEEPEELEETNEVVEDNIITLSSTELYEVYDDIHHMANTIIVAEDGKVWGTKEITREGIEDILEKLKGNDDKLYEDIKKWLDLDLSNAADVHNYVWSKFDGTEGHASGVDEDAITEIIKILQQ